MENKSKELEVAIHAALEAGKILEKHFETDILKVEKEDKSIVTLADKESEEVIKKIILEAFPDHSILGEETGLTQNQNEYIWQVDPIDGTRNFSNGIPLFAVSIALLKNDELYVGVIYNPATRSLFYAEKNKGAFLNDKRIFVSKDNYERAIISSGKGRKSEDRELCRELIYLLPKKLAGLTVRDFGSTALDLAYVACGATEADLKCGLNIYDISAGFLLVLEAGGVITNFDGGPWKLSDKYFLVSNGIFHSVLVEEIKKISV
ncbi:MAG: inositol monophosphatase family protein [bacterium]